MAPRAKFRAPSNGTFQIAFGFGLILVVGTLLLMLPFASETGNSVGLKDAAFTATSAVCVTGLVLADSQAHWSPLGEVVILLLIQVGGLGYMLGTTLVLWVIGRQIGIRDRHMLRLYYGAPTMKETLGFAKGVAMFTFIFEFAGAIILSFAFMADGVPAKSAWWWGLFHAISGFNNAGFSITGHDLTPYIGNELVLATLIVLLVAGGIGFIPIVTLARRRSWGRLPLDSKLIFATSAVLLVAGAVMVTAVEWQNEDTFGGYPAHDRPMLGLFHSANARTTGFTTVDLGAMRDESKVTTMGLMFVGGAAGSTAGGVKVGAFALLLAVMLATIRGQEQVSLFRRQVPNVIVQQATTLALLHVGLVFCFSLALTFTSSQPFIDAVFEAISALGTVGYSTAGTVNFGTAGHIVLILAMLFGRFSALLLVLYMSKPRKKVAFQYAVDSVRLS